MGWVKISQRNVWVVIICSCPYLTKTMISFPRRYVHRNRKSSLWQTPPPQKKTKKKQKKNKKQTNKTNKQTKQKTTKNKDENKNKTNKQTNKQKTKTKTNSAFVSFSFWYFRTMVISDSYCYSWTLNFCLYSVILKHGQFSPTYERECIAHICEWGWNSGDRGWVLGLGFCEFKYICPIFF